jgi:cytochrome c oxidase assembly protein subunit 15
MMELSAVAGSRSSSYHRPCFVMAALTACAVFPLLFVGAGVTSKDAGMAFPDWPTSDKHFLNPPGWLTKDATLWEHGHRLIGWTVGMLAIGLAVTAWRAGGVRRKLGLAVLGAIIAQGVMGGIRVREISTTWAMVHGIWGQLCFGLACATALVSSRRWGSDALGLFLPAADTLQRLCAVTTAALLIQLVLGAALRHFGSDTALILHLVWAIVSSLLVGWTVLWVIGNYPHRDILETFGWLLGLLMASQLLLGGVALVVTRLGATSSALLTWLIPTAHVAVGALVLVCSTLLTLCSFRMLRPISAARPTEADASMVWS